MKNACVVALVVLFGATSAMAASLHLPFFNDGGPDIGDAFEDDEYATFVTLKNISGGALNLIVLKQFQADGTEVTLDENTFNLANGASVSWRVSADDDIEGPVGGAVPNLDLEFGSMEIVLPGGAVVGDVVGRVLTQGRLAIATYPLQSAAQ